MEPSTLPACRRIIRFARPLKGLSGIDKHLVVRPAGQSRRYYSLGLRSEKKDKAAKQRVVILGSGWAGYALAQKLDPAKFERVVISPRSHFVFTPLLASTAVGTLEFRAVLEPVRRLDGVVFRQGWADDIDFARKLVRVEANPGDADLSAPHAYTPAVTEAGAAASTAAAGRGDRFFDVPYDKLVVAVGAYSQTFGIPGVREHAHFLRDVSDARRIRLRVLSLFEAAAAPSVADDAERRRLLRFAVVGGGPTGIEFAAELHDLVHEDLARIYPSLAPLVDITVYDIAPAVLPMFDRRLAEYATGLFRRRGIRVRTETHLDAIRPAPDAGAMGHLKLRIREDRDEEDAGLVVWSTGLMQNPLVEKLVIKEIRRGQNSGGGAAAEAVRLVKDAKTGGIVTDAHLRARVSALSLPDAGNDAHQTSPAAAATLPDVYVIGDCSVVESSPALPKTAQVASQQAAYLARRMNRGREHLGAPEPPFRFKNWGTMAYLGGWKAIHQSSADELRGWAAWVLWRTAYLTYSMSVRNKIMVPVYWAISWLFGRDISRF